MRERRKAYHLIKQPPSPQIIHPPYLIECPGFPQVFIPAMLKLVEKVGQPVGMVVVNDSDRTGHLALLGLPFLFHQAVTNHVPNSLRAAGIALAGNEPVKPLEEFDRHRYPEPDQPHTDPPVTQNRILCYPDWTKKPDSSFMPRKRALSRRCPHNFSAGNSYSERELHKNRLSVHLEGMLCPAERHSGF